MYTLRNETINRQLVKAISGVDIDKLISHHPDLSVIMFIFNKSMDPARSKRKIIQELQQVEELPPTEQLYFIKQSYNYCYVRTKDNHGRIIGDLLLLTGENLRNPFLGITESVYTIIGHRGQLPKQIVQLLETINGITDIVLGLFLSPVFPLIKYASAKTLKSIGHAVNNKMTCLEQEFTLEEVFQLIYDSSALVDYRHSGSSYRRLYRHISRFIPTELKKVRSFKPGGLFVHEDINTGIYLEKYILVDYKGEQFQIIEKQIGQYYIFKIKSNTTDEKAIYFDQTTNKIYLKSELVDQGLEYAVVNSAYFIEIYGIQHEIIYDKQNKNHQLVLRKPRGKIDFIPVYREALSSTWHLTTHNNFPVFTAIEKKILNRIGVNIHNRYSYKAFPNTNPVLYGNGKIYRDALFYRAGPYVEMNGKLVPLRQKTQLSKPVIAYEVFDLKLPEKQGYPIEWDSSRWIFERVSSPHLSSQLNRLITPERFEEKIDMRSLSAPDSHGLRWNARNESFLKVQYRYIKVNKLTSHRYTLAATKRNTRINLRFKHNFFVIEKPEERLHWLLSASLSKRQKSPLKILKSQPNFNKATAMALLSAYHFPDSGLFSEYAFVLDIEQTGRIPSWATPFEKNTVTQKRPDNLTETVSVFKLDTPNVTYHLNLGKQIATTQFGNVFLDANNPHYVIKKYFDDMFIDPFIIGIYASQEADTLRRYYGSAANAFYTKNAKPYLQMYRIPGQTLASLPSNSLPKAALELFVDMIEKLNKLGIQYGSLRAEDIFWDPNSNTFYPVNINTIEKTHGFYESNQKNINTLDLAQANNIKEKIAEKMVL